MTTENNATESTTQTVDAGNKGEVITLEAALDKIKALESQFQEAVGTRDKAKEKLRKLEQDLGDSAGYKTQYETLFTEKSKLAEQLEAVTGEFNSFKATLQQEKVNATLQSAIEQAGAKSVGTVLKLIDKSKVELDEQGNVKAESLTALIEEVKTSDPILFGNETTFIDPGVKRAGDTSSEGIFDKEIKACKTQKEIEEVLRKYGKM
jgi:vacuolar-type H+-ATPase subunit I/STV1